MKLLGRFFDAALRTVARANAKGEAWPALPKQGFITGRTATHADVAAGNAVFVLETEGVSAGCPLAIVVPQYAYYQDEGKREPVIIIQAEQVKGLINAGSAAGRKMLGARLADGTHLAGLFEDFELLGKTPPRK